MRIVEKEWKTAFRDHPDRGFRRETAADPLRPPHLRNLGEGRDFSRNPRSWIRGRWLGAAMGLFGDASLHLLLDPDYWRPRLERLARRPRQLVIFPRPDLEQPGIEVLELRLRAHDGEKLTALMARSAFAQNGESVYLRPCREFSSDEPDWCAVEAGHTDVLFRYPGSPGERKLEDRVLDVLRVVHAACSIESVDCAKICFLPCRGGPNGSRDVPGAMREQDSSFDRPCSAGNGDPEAALSETNPAHLPDEFAIAMFFRSRGWI